MRNADIRSTGVKLVLWGTIVLLIIPGVARASSPSALSADKIVQQLKYSTGTFFYDMVYEADGIPLPLEDLANKTCPNSKETKKRGLARNPDKLHAYVKTFFDGIQILQVDPAHKILVEQMNKAILLAGDAVVDSRIEISFNQWGWNNLSSGWDAWGNGTCSDVNTPNIYASAKAMMVLQAAFALTPDEDKRRVYYDAFVKGANHWLDFTPNPMMDAGSAYSVKTKKWGVLNVDGIKNFYAAKPANGIFKNVIVGGQRTDYCPGPGCTAEEKSLNDALSSPSTLGLPRPFRFHYTKDDPGLVTVNCSALMGLALLKMGLTLREMNDSRYPMIMFDIPLRSKDGSRTDVSNRDIYYIGYWTLYSDHYNLAQIPSNASYYDVDTPLYNDVSYESHLAQISSPVLAEAGALLKRADYLEAAVRSIKENESSILTWTDRMYAYCTLQNLDPNFQKACAEASKERTPLAYNYVGLTVTQFITWDLTAPNVALTAPATGRVLTSVQTVPVSAIATDDSEKVAEVFFLRNGQTVAISTTAPFGLKWDVTPETNGAHVWTAVARDAGGNRRVSSPVSVQVAIDRSSPTVTLTSPRAGTIISVPGTIPLTAGASDDLGIAKVWFEIDGVAVATAVPPSFSAVWPVTHIDNGIRTLTATAFDISGKKTTSDPMFVRVDIPVPWFDTFDGEAAGSVPTLWSAVQNAGTELRVDSTTFHGPAGLSLRLDDDSATGYCQIQKTFPATDSFYFKGSFRFSETNKKHYVILGNGDKSGLYLLYALNGRWMRYDGMTESRLSGDTTGYVAGRWYDVEVEGNFTAGAYSVWIDGSPIGTDLPLPGGNTRLTGFRILPAPASMTGRLWVDDVYFAAVRPPVDLLGPRVGKLSFFNITETSAEAAWTTEEPAACRIDFGATLEYGRNWQANPGHLTSHRGILNGLDSGIFHHVRVQCADAAGNSTVSDDNTFTTLPDTIAPTASLSIVGSTGTIRWVQTRELSVAANDNVRVTRVQFLRDGVVVATVTAGPYLYNWSVSHLDNGSTAWSARAYDASGNQTLTALLPVGVDIPAPFSDDFEGDLPGGSPSKWGVTAQMNTQVAVIDSASLGRSGRVALLSDLSTAGYCQIQRSGPAMGRVYFMTAVRFESTSGKHYVFLGTGDKGSLYFITAKSGGWWTFDGTVEYRLPGDKDGYQSGFWYNVEAVVDFTTGVYDVWVNGLKIGSNIPVPGGNQTITGFRFLPASASMTGKMWVDDIYFATARPLVATGMALPSVLKGIPPESVDGARAYPVPFRPSHGANGITFDQLPEETAIHIFSIDGRPVKTLTTDTEGKVLWTLDNDDGSSVVSGVYMAMIEKGGTRKKLKVVVQK